MRIPRQQGAAAAILKTSSPDPKRGCGATTSTGDMAAKMAGLSTDAERGQTLRSCSGIGSDDGRYQEQQRPGPSRASSVAPPATPGRKTSRESVRSANEPDGGADGGDGSFRHMYDTCAHCDWIWKGDACDVFYRELAESRTESIKYELASRPNPGLLGRFFAEKGYQRGRPVPETPSQATSPPRRGGTWESDADWRTRISGLASHEKRSRRTAKLVLAQQALSRLRRWTSGHHHRAADGSPVRQDLMEEAKSAEEARTLLRQPPYDHEAYSEDASMGGGGGTKTSSSAGDLLLRAGVPPSHYKGISRRVQSTTAVPAKTQEAGHLRASGDFCFPSTSGGPYQEGLRAASAASSEVAWSNAKKGHLFATSQRSIDGFFRRLVRKK
ncbi:uncharacterized protein LOC144109901 isoform X1 [Amblyomma americanum]